MNGKVINRKGGLQKETICNVGIVGPGNVSQSEVRPWQRKGLKKRKTAYVHEKANQFVWERTMG